MSHLSRMKYIYFSRTSVFINTLKFIFFGGVLIQMHEELVSKKIPKYYYLEIL